MAVAFLRGALLFPRIGIIRHAAALARRCQRSLLSTENTFPRCTNSASISACGTSGTSGVQNSFDKATLARGACRVADVRGRPVPYGTAWRWQHALAAQLRADATASDVLLLLEHAPVYTLGTASSPEHVLFHARELRAEELDADARPSWDGCGAMADGGSSSEATLEPTLVRTERGGEVTYHGPGQLVAYPILNLARHRRDLHWYLRSLEETVIVMLRRHYGLNAQRKPGLTGVWVGDAKVCAMGLKVSKWVTMHGLALNVTADLAPFDRIVPCGINNYGVTSLQLLAGDRMAVCMEDARLHFAEAFIEVFGPYDSLDALGANAGADIEAFLSRGAIVRSK
jgi:lipoyl(octanoyl) transferase